MGARHLVVRAGARATDRLRAEGFHPDRFDTLVGASGGPKWLVLRHLDEVLIERLILARTTPLDTLGSSIGSFRHACFAQKDPSAAIARFLERYIAQAYEGRPTMEAISQESGRILAHTLGEHGSNEIVGNDLVRSHFVASRLRRDRGRDRGLAFQLQLGTAAASNLASRSWLERFFTRVLFGPERAEIGFGDFATKHVALSPDNLPHALLASGSIPLVMEGVRSTPDLPGMLFDGGIIDYHFDFTFRRRKGLVLFSHFFDRITPGWFDKPLPWRRPALADLSDVVMLAPSDSFVAGLPGGRVPDRNDFLELDTKARIRRWQTVVEHCRALADEFDDLLSGGRLADAIEPFRA